MTASFIKKLLMIKLSSGFIGFKFALANIDDDTVIIKTDSGTKTGKLGSNAEAVKNLKLLSDLLGIDKVNTIYVEKERDVIVLSGTMKNGEPVERVL